MRVAPLLLPLASPAATQTLAPRPVQALLMGSFQEPDLRESSGVLLNLDSAIVCNLAGLEPQGEGVVWLDNRRLLLTREAPSGTRAGPIHIVTCAG